MKFTDPATSHDQQHGPWRGRRIVLLAAAVLLVLGVNVVRMVQTQSYFAHFDHDASASEEHAPSASAPKATQGCVTLEKSHVDPNFHRADACYSREQVLAILKQLVFTGAAAFDAHNVTYFLDSGTLLGAFREKKVIAHDNDADVGIDAAGLEYIRHHPIDFPPEYFFTVWNSTLYPKSDRDDKLPARLIHKLSGLYLDVFAFLDWTDEKTGAAQVGPLPSWCFFNCAGCPKAASGGKSLRVAPDWIYPLVNCTFEGVETLKCPHKTEEYLQYTFGKSFRKPVKYNY